MVEASRYSFHLEEFYEALADRTEVRLEVKGHTPINDFADLHQPLVRVQGITSSSSGTIPGGGWTYWIAVCATDAAGKQSAPSALSRVVVTVPDDSNTITIPIVSWDPDTVGWVAYAGQSPNSLTRQANGSGTPDSITISNLEIWRSGVPDQEFDHFSVKVKRVFHAGVWGAEVTSRTGSTVTILGAGWDVNEYAGYDLSLVHFMGGGFLAMLNYRVVSNTSEVLTLDRTTDEMGPGDIVVMRSKPTVSGKTLTDPRWINPISGGTGLNPVDEPGRVVRIITGQGRGQTRRIASATTTSITVDIDWDQIPNSDSRYIIEEPSWVQTTDTAPLSNFDEAALTTISVPVSNYIGQSLLVMAFTVDGGGHESVEQFTPFREIYIRGTPNPPAAEGYSDDPIVAGAVTPDVANGVHHRVLLTENVLINPAIYSSGTLTSGQRFTLKLVQDPTGGYGVTWSADYVGMTNVQIDLTPDTYSNLLFTYNPEGKWELQQATHGLS